jgi:hypothetical protein
MHGTTLIRATGLRLATGSLALAIAACGSAATPSPVGTIGPGATSDPGSSASAAPGGPTATTTTATGTTGGTVDGCRYASTAEVGTAYGFTATTATATPPADDNYAYCQYASADGRTVILTYVSRTQIALSIYDGYKKQSDETVSGIGDEAFWADDVLYIKKGVIFAAIQARSGGSGTVDKNDAGEVLGKIIAGRL